MQIKNNRCLCKISLCPPKEETNTQELLNSSPMMNSSPSLFAIEFQSPNPNMKVGIGSKINEGDIIAYSEGYPLKSKMKGTILEVYPQYIIGEYTVDTESFASLLNESPDKLISSSGTNEMDEISEILETNTNTITFLKDFILRFRFADFAINTIDSKNTNALKSYTTVEKISKKYEKSAEKIIKEYEDEIKKICDKDNIKTLCENNRLNDIKTDLDNAKKKCISKILKQYRSTETYGYTSGKISDFTLYPLYMEYITGDKFAYDDNNPYIVELYDALNQFLRMRSRIEMNCTNIDGLVTKFNMDCDSILKEYWSVNDRDYYSKLKENFLYDFYSDDENELIEASINDKNRTTLYSKVLDFLKTLTKYKEPQSASDKYKNTDIDTLINSGDSVDSDEEKRNKELLSNLKRISITFVSLRKIENDNQNYSYFSDYISKDDLNEVFTLKDTLDAMNIDIKEYSTLTKDPSLLKNSNILKKYLGALKGITENESKILKELSDKAIDWYNKNSSDVDSGKIFDKFKEISWPSPSIIMKSKKTCDFFYIESMDSISKKEANLLNESDFPDDGLRTKFGITSYQYWLKYFTIATLVNCMLPMYWSTGLPPPTGPTPLPIIFIPIVVMPGRVITVIGVAICGICPMPMIYLVNVSDTPGFIIPVITMIIDTLKGLCGKIVSVGIDSMNLMIEGLIKGLDNKINSIDEEIRAIDKDILNLHTGVKEDKEILRNIKKKRKEISTTNKRKGGV